MFSNVGLNNSSYYDSDEEMFVQEELEAAKNSVCPGKPLIVEERTLDDVENKSDVKEENFFAIFYAKTSNSARSERYKKRLFSVTQPEAVTSASSYKKMKIQKDVELKEPIKSLTSTTTTNSSSSLETESEEVSDSLSNTATSSCFSVQCELSPSVAAIDDLPLPPNKRQKSRYLVTYQAFVSTNESLKNSGSFEETAACILPIPFQENSWLEVIKLAHSIREAEKKEPMKTENALRMTMHALKFLSRNDIRAGALTTLEKAMAAKEKAVDFYLNLEKLSQYKNSESIQPFETIYRLEFYEFSKERKYMLYSVANPEKDVTIRIYKTYKQDKTRHYDLLILKD